MSALTSWILGHRRLVALCWLIVVIISLAGTTAASNSLTQSTASPGQPGYRANAAVLQTYGNGGDNPPLVPVITLPAGTTVGSSGVRAQLGATLANVQRSVPHLRIVSYASTSSRLFVSADGRTTFALIFLPVSPLTGDTSPAANAVAQILRRTAIRGAPFHVTGLDALSVGGGGGGNSALVETLLGGVGALLVLAFVFGSLLAFVPLLMAVVAIPTTFLLVWGLTTITDISFIVEYLISLIGLGIAIDYSLLIIMRWREERAAGRENLAAVRRAMETAGKAVVVSGSTVAIGLLALVVLPVPFLRSVGLGGLLIPAVSVLVATTLLPVVLSVAGPRLDWPRRDMPRQSRFWTRWGRALVRRRWIAAGAAVLILAAIAAPALSLQLGRPQASALAQSGDAYLGLQALGTAGIGPGPLCPMEVLVHSGDAGMLADRIVALPGVRGAVAPTGPGWHAGGTALALALPAADGSSASGLATLDRVRQLAQASPGGGQVAGPTAQTADMLSAIYGNFPLIVALLSVVTFVLLARAFRSLLLALKAVVLVLVSVGAALGFMTFVWQQGHGSELWGVSATGGVNAWIPVLVFAFLFGISMDYEVFLLARMREEYDRRRLTDEAVVAGIGSTGRLVTSAALILCLAFLALASAPDVGIKIIATGLAAGIVLDATVIRMLLVPALVSLLGSWNWWLPTALARILRVRPAPLQDVPPDKWPLDPAV
jgi:RND superfamily putative drug exporter